MEKAEPPLMRLWLCGWMTNDERRAHSMEVAARLIERHNVRAASNPRARPMHPTPDQLQAIGNALWRFARAWNAGRYSIRPEGMRAALQSLGELGDLPAGRPQDRRAAFVAEMQRWHKLLTGTRGCSLSRTKRLRDDKRAEIPTGSFLTFMRDAFRACDVPPLTDERIYDVARRA